MHLVLLTRGINEQVNNWRNLLEAQRFPWKRKNLQTGKEEMILIQGALRPIQIWEYVFPEESLNDVLGGMNVKGPIERKEIKPITWMISKILKLDPIPKIDNFQVTGYTPPGTLNGANMPAAQVHSMMTEGVACYPLGIKKDARGPSEFTLKDGTKVNYDQERV